MEQYIFFAVYALFLLGIGLYGMKRSKTFNDYFLGSRSIGPWLSAFTYGTAYFSAVLLIGFAGKLGWGFGFSSLWVAFGNTIVGTLLVWLLVGKKIRKASHDMNVYTMPEYLHARYNSHFLKIFSAIAIFIFLIPYAASVFLGLSYLFEITFKMNFVLILVIMAGLTSIYMILGGYRSIAIVDLIQGIVMIAGVTLMVYFGITRAGGLTAITAKLNSINPKLTGFIGPPGFFPLFYIVVITSVAPFAMPQLVQKFYSVKDDKSINIGMIVSTIFAIIITGAAYFTGSLTRVFINAQKYPEIFSNGSPMVDKLIPIFIRDVIPSGVSFVILLLVLTASMSTLASLIFVSASAIVKDLYHGYSKKLIPDAKLNLLMRIFCGVFIIISVIFAVLRPAIILTMLLISWGAIAATFLAPFLYGLFWKRANKYAAIISSISGISITMILFFILPPSKIPFIATLGMGIPMILFPIIVWLTPKKFSD
ncbi:MAG: sodium:solute symporter [Candidatus Celaenobacter polaris]|nr:sodium:solute symporter [Candidatus Celaenobacter polaris]